MIPPKTMTLSSAFSMQETCLAVAGVIAISRSKDPRTKVGAVVYDPETGGMFFGYNGFPKNIPDETAIWETPNKYDYVVHAEVNAIRKATSALGHHVSRCELYSTNHPCHCCMKDAIIPAGIKKIRYINSHPEDELTDEWIKMLEIDVRQLTIHMTLELTINGKKVTYTTK